MEGEISAKRQREKGDVRDRHTFRDGDVHTNNVIVGVYECVMSSLGGVWIGEKRGERESWDVCLCPIKFLPVFVGVKHGFCCRVLWHLLVL